MKLLQGDCLELMKTIEDQSVDMILCDLPYGTTSCKWDTLIPLEPLWRQYERIIKNNGAIALFATNPFASRLVMSNPKLFRYEWIWDKTRGFNFQQANYCPMKQHELICMFSKMPSVYSKRGSMRYYPIKEKGAEYKSSMGTSKLLNTKDGGNRNYQMKKLNTRNKGRFPKTIRTIKKEHKSIHPTQKPVALLEYLIRTYTQENELVLDNCMGSGSTGIACLNTGREFIGMELDGHYFSLASKRIADWGNEV